MKKYKSIIIFGAPCTGKGTQARLLAKTGKYFHFSAGDIFRSLGSKTEIGKKISKLINKGEFVPDSLAAKLIKKSIKNLIYKKKYIPEKQILILDGFPRNIKQIKFLKRVFNIIKIVHIRSNNKLLIIRMKKRIIKEKREDDREDVINNRLDIYKKETLPVLNKFDKKLIINIDGSENVKKVHKNIIKVLNSQ